MISVTLNFDSPDAAKAFLTFTSKAKYTGGTPKPLIAALAASALRSAVEIVRGSDGNIIASTPKISAF